MAMWSCPRLNGHRTYSGIDVGYSLGTFFYRNHECPSPEWRRRGKLGRQLRGWLAAPGSQLCPARQNLQGLVSLLQPSQLGTTWLAGDFFQVLTAAALHRLSWLLGSSS